MAVYAISDTHFGHSNILQFRTQFSSIKEHDQFIVDKILSRCGKRDSLYILGDVVIYADALPYLKTIAEHVEYLHIVLGNHDLERKACPSLNDYQALCKSVTGMKRYKNAWLTHAPIHPDELRGRINVHGHIHDKTIDDPRYVNVSCEAISYTPINLADVLTAA